MATAQDCIRNGVKPEIIDEVTTLASSVFGVPASRISADTTPEQVDNWDSIGHVTLVSVIEERFEIQFTPEEIIEMRSVGKIAELLSVRLENEHSH